MVSSRWLLKGLHVFQVTPDFLNLNPDQVLSLSYSHPGLDLCFCMCVSRNRRRTIFITLLYLSSLAAWCTKAFKTSYILVCPFFFFFTDIMFIFIEYSSFERFLILPALLFFPYSSGLHLQALPLSASPVILQSAGPQCWSDPQCPSVRPCTATDQSTITHTHTDCTL